MRLDSFAYTNQGGRDYNQDSVVCSINGENGIFVVADGLGGHKFGELASNCACNMLNESWNTSFEKHDIYWLEKNILTVNDAILKLQEEKQANMKTTVVALTVENGKACFANVGDSRLYYFHNSKLIAYTRDHSVAYKKYLVGDITRDQLRTDEDQSSLLRTVGSEERCKPEYYMLQDDIEPGDAFLLCSDGAWEYFSDEELLIDLLKADSAKSWAELVLLRILDRVDGTNDNLSLVTLMVH